jgi:hypothetical protein
MQTLYESGLHLRVLFIKIRFNNIILSIPMSCKWILPSGFSTKILYAFLVCLRRTHPFHSSWFDHPSNMW